MRLNLREILYESASFYKKNILHLFSFSAIYVINELVWSSSGIMFYVFDGMEESIELVFMMATSFFLFSLWLIAMVVFGPRLILAIILFINHLMDGNRIALTQAYKETKGKYWIALGFFILIILVRDGPIILFQNLDVPYGRLMSTLYYSCIRAVFYLLLPIIALNKKSREYLKRAIKMIKGNFLKIVLINVLIISLVPYVYNRIEWGIYGASFMFIEMNLLAIILLFVFPFAQTVNVVVYRKLAKETVNADGESKLNEACIPKESMENRKRNSWSSGAIMVSVILLWFMVMFYLNALFSFYVAFFTSWLVLAYGIFLVNNETHEIKIRGVSILILWAIFFIIGIMRIILSL